MSTTPRPSRNAGNKFCLQRTLAFRIAVTVCFSAALISSTAGQSSQHPTADLLSELIQIDTSNPPGNTDKVAHLLTRRLRPLGLEIQVVPTPDTGKAHF